MKFFLSTVLLLPALASAFAPAQSQLTRVTSLSAGKPAKNYDEDLEMTRKVIEDSFKSKDGEAPAVESPKETEEE
ncbi:MAG: hypothetical protein ACI8RD_014154 [Bacillariaceae sp.]|jgi:hypothetical protein